ncbi:40S ribosomal protein S29 [Bagarius yarrelli]|uniref:Small ribosomal subunit protein uS14 n=1 Tax=Bagarius yarrelli TaxID=175774 RepID=A0A556TT14_BAGYA|nr:40S ribosomal protein S29 [Bagarius yarrelli]
MGHQQLYWSHPRKFGQGSRSCRVCSNRHGLIRKYGLNMCRQCFRQYAKDIGFVKASIYGRLLFVSWYKSRGNSNTLGKVTNYKKVLQE